jgi:hypothetical protein
MSNVFDELDAKSSANVFDNIPSDSGNVFDSIPSFNTVGDSLTSFNFATASS